MKSCFSNHEGQIIIRNMITAIQRNKQYLSDIDGAIGDGDHGINMNKGFTQCETKLEAFAGDFSFSLKTLSMSLMSIGGSMGPLYGMIFQAMGKTVKEVENIDAPTFQNMLESAVKAITTISDAKPGDKTLMDALVPAVEKYKASLAKGDTFENALKQMKQAAKEGSDSTQDMIAKKGRSSRLGERSRGVVDAGSASCALLLGVMADSMIELLK